MRQVYSIIGSASLAGLAVSSPQQIDFSQVQAAPAVASGPVDNGVANQTATLATTFAVSGPVSATASAAASSGRRSLQRRQDNIITRDNAGFGTSGQTTTINAGDLYWLNGAGTHNFQGNIVNNGGLYVSQTNALTRNPYLGGQTSDWVGHDTFNGNLQNNKGATIQLNDHGSRSAPTYDWYIRQLKNEGTIQWCGRGDTGGSTFQMYNDLDSTNNGLISFEQFFDNKGAAFVWRNPTLSTSASPPANLYNNGAFRLINVNYHNVQNIYGNGCWQLGKGAILYLEDGTGVFQNPTKGPSLPQQSITFQDSSAVLHMDTAVYSRNSDFGPQVYGYGDGNAIEFYETISKFAYDSGRGVLTVTMVSRNVVNIKIGQGYDSSRFVQQRNPQKYANYNAIFYRGSAPQQAVPAQCSLSAPVCGDLGANPPTNGKPLVTSSTSSSSSSSMSSTSSTSSQPTTSSKPLTSPTSSQPTTSSTSSQTTTSSTSSKPTTSSTSSQPTTSPTSSKPTTSSTSSQPTTSPTSSKPTQTSSTVSPPNTTSFPPKNSGTYTPYYPALETSYTTDPALGTTTNTAPGSCPTQPEAGTDCGFINPLDPCAPQPDGFGPVPKPDTPSAFLNYAPFHASASAAPTAVPAAKSGQQYVQTFKDLNAASAAQSYLALWTLKTYSTSECAMRCDQTELCTAFNLFVERDPSLNPSSQVSSAPTVWGYICPNPPSMTSFKCTLWGSSLDSTTATNAGQRRADFDIVITASNGYDKTNTTVPAAPPGYGQPTSCGNKAIDAPDHAVGSHFFPGPYNPRACASVASAQSAANAKAGSPAVRMFNAYYLLKNGRPHGTYCGLYGIALGPERATNGGAREGGDTYECRQSWTFESL